VAGQLSAHLLDGEAAGLGGVFDGDRLAGGGQQRDQVRQQVMDAELGADEGDKLLRVLAWSCGFPPRC
jgi:hypothetical protein